VIEVISKTLLLAFFCFAVVLAVGGAASAAEADSGTGSANKYMAAGLAMGLAGIGAGIAISGAGSASAGAVAEKPETFGKVVIFVALAEAIALYGLVVAIMILVS
jgi:V/A-type H+-transporting ATPase subunit K